MKRKIRGFIAYPQENVDRVCDFIEQDRRLTTRRLADGEDKKKENGTNT